LSDKAKFAYFYNTRKYSLSPTEFSKIYGAVRAQTLSLTERLSPEDMALQSMPDASPTKWHLAHTTWFFETVALQKWYSKYVHSSRAHAYLFNSYYEALGERQPRPQRGMLSRPTFADVLAYREQVDSAMIDWLQGISDAAWALAQPLLILGLHHEQQHQELIMTDMLHLLAQNPLLPAWLPQEVMNSESHAKPLHWLEHPGGLHEVGTDALDTFAFDNECPKHKVWLEPFVMANRLVTCGEYLAFMADGGYQCPEFWLSEGWARVQQEGWRAPQYWIAADDKRLTFRAEKNAHHWQVFGVHGLQAMQANAPVTHLSFYEASAYAVWAGARLPTEFEWEVLAKAKEAQAEQGLPSNDGLESLYGVAWQWTRSSYDPYPGFAAMQGDVAEYNGKFMVQQLVLRGSSRFTSTKPFAHARATYRNFFPPSARWQCTGLRLAKDLKI
jgi:ergothioneine biosynthesis protein EgtB